MLHWFIKDAKPFYLIRKLYSTVNSNEEVDTFVLLQAKNRQFGLKYLKITNLPI